MDYGRRFAKDMGVKFATVDTARDGIIPALMTDKFDIIMGGMTITQERNIKNTLCRSLHRCGTDHPAQQKT